MKKLKYLILLLAMILVLPLAVFAEEDTTKEQDKQAIVYFFRGEGCSHCAEAEEWFESIEEEYGEKFKIVDYETWYSEDNAELMQKVAKARGEEEQATGVPYIIIGEKSWVGFADEYKEEIKDQIDLVYSQNVADRYDAIEFTNSNLTIEKESKSSSSDVIALIIIVAACGALGFGIYKARQTTN